MTRIHRGKTRRTRRAAFGAGRIGDPDLERRLRAAGLGRDDPTPEDIDEFRGALARRIAMIINRWPGCPEPACRRARGCMAPNLACTNARGKPMSARARARAMARMRRMLTAKAAEMRAAEAAAAAAAPFEKPGRGKTAPFVPVKAGTQL